MKEVTFKGTMTLNIPSKRNPPGYFYSDVPRMQELQLDLTGVKGTGSLILHVPENSFWATHDEWEVIVRAKDKSHLPTIDENIFT